MPRSLLSLLWHSLRLNLNQVKLLFQQTTQTSLFILQKNYSNHLKKKPKPRLRKASKKRLFNIIAWLKKREINQTFNTIPFLVSSCIRCPGVESVNPRSRCRTQTGYWKDLGLGLSQTWSISCRGRDGKRERGRWVSLCGVAISPQSLVRECAGVTRSPALPSYQHSSTHSSPTFCFSPSLPDSVYRTFRKTLNEIR